MQRRHIRVDPRPRDRGILVHQRVHVHQVVALVVAPQGVIGVDVAVFGLSENILLITNIQESNQEADINSPCCIPPQEAEYDD